VVFVDTSVWITAFRSRRSAEAAHLTGLLDDDRAALSVVARLEVLTGTTERNRSAVRRALSALPLFRPVPATWDRVEGWVELASAAGERFGVADLVVASVAVDHDAELWSLDTDFERMQSLGFVRLHVPGPRT
jgi:predicted nucleic acid-binding protein